MHGDSVTVIGSESVADIIPLLVAFGEESQLEKMFDAPLDPKYTQQQLEMLIDHDCGRVIAAFSKDGDVLGAIGFVITQHIFTNKLTFQEIFWYVYPEVRERNPVIGIKLIKEFERNAKNSGAEIAIASYLSTLQPERLQATFKRLGWRDLETSVAKNLTEI